jgi:hypothetical protein
MVGLATFQKFSGCGGVNATLEHPAWLHLSAAVHKEPLARLDRGIRMNDPAHEDVLRQAVQLCEEPQYRTELQKRLDARAGNSG